MSMKGTIALMMTAALLMISAAIHGQYADGNVEDGILERAISKDIGSFESYFIENAGQLDNDEVFFYGRDQSVFFTSSGVYFRFIDDRSENFDGGMPPPRFGEPSDSIPIHYQEKGSILKYEFVDANEVVPSGKDRCSWNSNFFLGNDPDRWRCDVPNYNGIIYTQVWEGIDIVYALVGGSVKYDLIISPGADPSQASFDIIGCSGLSVDPSGDLVISTDMGDIVDRGLIAFYQDDENDIIPVDFKIEENSRVGFDIGAFDVNRAVVIDPLLYSTFIGGSNYEIANAIAVDTSGNSYISGYTYSSGFPTTPGAYNTTYNSNADVFITKLNASGTGLIYSTFIGGSSTDIENGLAIDPSGNAYVTGRTYSSDYPTTSGSYDTTQNGHYDIFVTKLNSNGSALLYSTFIGGSLGDYGRDIAVDTSGNAYVTGFTYSTNFPTTTGAYDTSHNGNADAFVLKLNSAGTALSYSTYIGGSGYDESYGIALDTSSNAYITGDTSSSNFPTTTGAYDTSHNGVGDAFIAKLNSAGSSLTYSTYIGGTDNELGFDIAVDDSNNAYVTGWTKSTDFPTTVGAYNTSHNGGFDAFITKLNATGTGLVYSTYLGASGDDQAYAIDIDPDGNAYVTGWTKSTAFPTTSGAYDSSHNGWNDVFVTKMDSSGSSLMISTFIGGTRDDYGYGITVDDDDIYVTGYTESSGYPTTTGAFDTTHNGGADVFVTKLGFDSTPPVFGIDGTKRSGTTGDPFMFSISVNDNNGISSVHVEYWFGAGDRTNASMEGTGPYTHLITVPSNSTDDLNYIFHAVDTSGNHNKTAVRNVTIIDNDRPVFGVDGTKKTGTTGDPFMFMISVYDNIGISSVHVEYWFGAGDRTNASMEGTGPYTHLITVPSNSTDDLYYKFHAVDTSGNRNDTAERTVTIIDNDRPEFGVDGTKSSGTTGDPFMFTISVYDNIGISSVHVEYWFGAGDRTNASMEGTGPYMYLITVPSDSTDALYYKFHAVDTTGNRNDTAERTVTITDNDRPEFGVDGTKKTGTTGDPFMFTISVYDNIGTSSVHVEYWFGVGDRTNASMEGTGPYTYLITVPSDSTDALYYKFHAVDTSGNHNKTAERNVTITDNDRPEFGVDGTKSSGTTGNPFMFTIYVGDNIGISSVHVEYWFGTGDRTNASMEGTGPYTYLITIPFNSTDPLNYLFRCVDISGNWNGTAASMVKIIDNVPPAFIDDRTPTEASTGSEIVIGVEVTDNIGIDSVMLEYWFGDDGEHTVVEMEYDGTIYHHTVSVPVDSVEGLNYVISALDVSGLDSSTPLRTVSIIDDIPPSIALIDDLVISIGSSIDISAIASDNIGIVSYEWFGSPVPSSNGKISGVPSEPGTYNVTLIVTDLAGNNATVSFEIKVLPSEQDDNDQEDPEEDPNGSDPKIDENENKRTSIPPIVIIAVFLIILIAIAIIIYLAVKRSKDSLSKDDQSLEE